MDKNLQSISASGTRPPHLNALKHGLRSQTQILPGEDAAEFQQMRQGMYDLYRPRSGNEARCVEAMANHEWVMERCRRVRDEYHGMMTAVLHGDPDAGQHCEGDPHRWHHKALDCTLEEGRLQRHQEREWKKLLELQHLRKLRLLEDLEHAELPEMGADLRSERVAEEAARDSDDGRNGETCKREAPGAGEYRPRPGFHPAAFTHPRASASVEGIGKHAIDGASHLHADGGPVH